MNEIARLRRQREDDRDELERLARELRQAHELVEQLRQELNNEQDAQAEDLRLKQLQGLVDNQYKELQELRRELRTTSEPHRVSPPSTHEEIMASDNKVIKEAYQKSRETVSRAELLDALETAAEQVEGSARAAMMALREALQ